MAAVRPALGKLVDVGLPTAVFSQPFSGHGWMYFPAWQKAGKKVVLLPTSDWSEIDRVVGLMRVAPRMRQTKILAVGQRLGTEAACSIEDVKKKLGTEVIPIDNEEVIAAHQAIDLKAAEAEAEEYWLSKAKRIVEPKREEIINSARLYLAVKGLMLKYGARATTSSHCMGLPAKGCLTYSKLNDLGMVGACEGDMDSTLTMLMFQYAFGLPGFISDPVFDTASNALIHFHCTCATKMDGPTGKRLPFTIRTQSDSERGVSLDVEQRIGQPVTCAKFINARHDADLDRQDLQGHPRRTRLPHPVLDRGGRRPIDVPQLGRRRAQRRHDDPIAPRRVLRQPHAGHRGPRHADGNQGRRGGIVSSFTISVVRWREQTTPTVTDGRMIAGGVNTGTSIRLK